MTSALRVARPKGHQKIHLINYKKARNVSSRVGSTCSHVFPWEDKERSIVSPLRLGNDKTPFEA